MSWEEQSFREKIEQEHEFPGQYIFKFIVPESKKDEITALLPQGDVRYKESSGGKYVSVTLITNINCSEEVLQVYRSAHTIEGIIAL